MRYIYENTTAHKGENAMAQTQAATADGGDGGKPPKTRTQMLMDALAEPRPNRWDPPKEGQETVPVAPAEARSTSIPSRSQAIAADTGTICMEDYFNQVSPIPEHAMLLGKVVGDNLPLMIDLDDPQLAHVLHIMCDDKERSRQFMQSIARVIEYQFQPFRASGYPFAMKSKYHKKVTYSVLTFWPELWQAEKERGAIVLPAAGKTGDHLKPLVDAWEVTWQMKKQVGFLFVDNVEELTLIPNAREVVYRLMELSQNPEAHLRIVMASPVFDDYQDPPDYATPFIASDNRSGQVYCPPGQFRVWEGDKWLPFQTMQPRR
jgi:hypothetical protein